MRKFYFLFVIFLFFTACENREPEAIIIPNWLEPRLIELENSGDCNGCTVQRWTYEEEFFYHVYCSYWSCLDCEVYRYNGDSITWNGDINHADFEANKSRPEIIWQCGDEL